MSDLIPWPWTLGLAGLALAVVAQRAVERLRVILREERRAPRRVASYFEFWPPWMFYIPVGIWYVLLAIRYRSLTLPSCANPSIYSGGITRESKSQILSLVPHHHAESVARWTVVPSPLIGTALPPTSVEIAEELMAKADLSYPVVAKPDEGERGTGVRLVRTREELAQYLEQYRSTSALVVQEYVDLPPEAGIFWLRMPGAPRGRIFSVTVKEFPEVVGDGTSTLRELILRHPRASLRSDLFLNRFASRLTSVPPPGDHIPLVFTGNHCRGAVFRNGAHLVTPQLEQWTEDIAQSLPGFHFGRFDVRFASEAHLRRADGLRIIEVNGASSEATHIWDPDASLLEAWRVLFKQFSLLFQIADANRRLGIKPIGGRKLLRDILIARRNARALPPN